MLLKINKMEIPEKYEKKLQNILNENITLQRQNFLNYSVEHISQKYVN